MFQDSNVRALLVTGGLLIAFVPATAWVVAGLITEWLR